MWIEAMTHKPSLKYWLAAAEELGFQTSADPNAIQMQGTITCKAILLLNGMISVTNYFIHKNYLALKDFGHLTSHKNVEFVLVLIGATLFPIC